MRLLHSFYPSLAYKANVWMSWPTDILIVFLRRSRSRSDYRYTWLFNDVSGQNEPIFMSECVWWATTSFGNWLWSICRTQKKKPIQAFSNHAAHTLQKHQHYRISSPNLLFFRISVVCTWFDHAANDSLIWPCKRSFFVFTSEFGRTF